MIGQVGEGLGYGKIFYGVHKYNDYLGACPGFLKGGLGSLKKGHQILKGRVPMI